MAQEHLYNVSIQNKTTKNKVTVQVWAQNTDDATHKLVGTLIGPDCEYRWTGTGPEYKENKIVTRIKETHNGG